MGGGLTGHLNGTSPALTCRTIVGTALAASTTTHYDNGKALYCNPIPDTSASEVPA